MGGGSGKRSDSLILAEEVGALVGDEGSDEGAEAEVVDGNDEGEDAEREDLEASGRSG